MVYTKPSPTSATGKGVGSAGILVHCRHLFERSLGCAAGFLEYMLDHQVEKVLKMFSKNMSRSFHEPTTCLQNVRD